MYIYGSYRENSTVLLLFGPLCIITFLVNKTVVYLTWCVWRVSERSQVAHVSVFPMLSISTVLSSERQRDGRQSESWQPGRRRRRDGALHRPAAASLHRSVLGQPGTLLSLPDGRLSAPSSDYRHGYHGRRGHHCPCERLPASVDAAACRKRHRPINLNRKHADHRLVGLGRIWFRFLKKIR